MKIKYGSGGWIEDGTCRQGDRHKESGCVESQFL